MALGFFPCLFFFQADGRVVGPVLPCGEPERRCTGKITCLLLKYFSVRHPSSAYLAPFYEHFDSKFPGRTGFFRKFVPTYSLNSLYFSAIYLCPFPSRKKYPSRWPDNLAPRLFLFSPQGLLQDPLSPPNQKWGKVWFSLSPPYTHFCPSCAPCVKQTPLFCLRVPLLLELLFLRHSF